MQAVGRRWTIPLLLMMAFSLLVSCNKISIPRMSFEEDPQVYLPIAVAYAFDPQLSQATLSVDACGFAYTIPTGNLISQAFVDVSQERFASVVTQPAGQPAPAGASSNVTVQLSLVNQSFEPTNRSGEEDRYNARITVELLAVFLDSQGHSVAKTPLRYQQTVRMWTPELSSQSTSCATGQFDQEFYDAGENLAKEMTMLMPQLFGQPPPPGTVAQSPIPPQATYPAIPQVRPPAPTLSFRTLLRDGNDNLVLEGGEKLVLQIETSNNGMAPTPSATVELTGSPSILEAFSRVTNLPLTIGPLQAGETKMTEIRGIMPVVNQASKGELIVSVRTPNGVSVGSHRILAAIQPGTSSPTRPAKSQNAPNGSPHYAILVGLDSYQVPWVKPDETGGRHLHAMAKTLQFTHAFDRDHIRILENARATRKEIEQAVFTWVGPNVTSDSIVFMYFGGHSLLDPHTGEIYLVPYEGSSRTAKNQLISLRLLQRALGKLRGHAVLLILDAPVTRLLGQKGAIDTTGAPSPRWSSGLTNRGNLIQVRRRSSSSPQEAADLLAGLEGRADRNHDGTITVEEFLLDLGDKAEILPSPDTLGSRLQVPLARP